MAFTSDNVQVFLAVLDQGSFSAAARKLERVPSAVSMAIAQLEADLDVQLFDRSGSRASSSPRCCCARVGGSGAIARTATCTAQPAGRGLQMGLEERLTFAIAPELLSTNWADTLTPLIAEFPACR